MPTLDEWVSALSVPRKISIDSSPDLIAAIQAKQAKQDVILQAKNKPVPARKPNLIAPAGLQPTQDFDLEPIHLLHRLGVVTTPPVPNLADICSTWAYMRYLWAFALPKQGPKNRLRLSELALNIDFHQKGLMSDQIGVGMAAVVMAMFFGAPDATDVDVALGGTAWKLKLAASSSPDYIFTNADKSTVYVVECKGTQSSRSAAVAQMAKGTQQVPSLQFTDGRPQPTTLVIGTRLTKTGVHVLIVDPPPDDSDGPPQDIPIKPTSNNSETDRPVRTGPRAWRIPDAAGFDRATRMISQAKLLSYAAADQTAVAKVRLVRPELTMHEPTPRTPVVRENRFGAFEGSFDVVPVREGVRLEVFQGIRRNIREAYAADNVEAVKAQTASLRATIATETTARKSSFGFEREETGEAVELRSVAPDGTMLELRISKP